VPDYHDEDGDMKIAGANYKKTAAEDPAETEAKLFLRHRETGNIEKARALGKKYAYAIMEAAPPVSPDNSSQVEYCQQIVLCAFLVTRVIVENSPDTIIAQTGIHAFYDELNSQSADLYQNTGDLAAFSLYTLWERSRTKDMDELGRIYAKLCGMEGDARAIAEGNALGRRFYAACLEMMANTRYIIEF